MIVVNCRFLMQPMTGVQRFAEENTEALAAIRDDLLLVAPPGPLRRNELGGLRVEQIGTHTGHRWEQWDLPRFVRSQGREAILLSLMSTGPVLLRNQVMTHHDVTYVRHPQSYSRAFRIGYRAFSTVTLRRARTVMTVSDFSRAEIADVYGIRTDKIHIVHNAAGTQFSSSDSAEADPPYFLAVASQLLHKNLAVLVRAYLAFANKTGSTTRLQLVGSKPTFSGAEARERIPDDPRVHWLGKVSDEELISLYRQARALVFPSLYEGFGVPPLEAQACGCPVVSSDAASLPEVLGDSALFFSPRDAPQLAQRLAAIDDDPDLRMRLREAGRANAARFSWAESARRISTILDGVDSR